MQQTRLAVLTGVLLLLAAFASRAIASANTEATPVWLASGVTFSALLLTQRGWWPGVLTGAAAASGIWGIAAHELTFGPALVFAAIEVVSIGTAAWIATLGHHDPESLTGAALLVAGALVGAALGGILAVELWRWQRPHLDMFVEWRAWSFSTALGLLLVTPVSLAFRGFRLRRSGGMPMTQFLAGGLAFIVFITCTLLVFSRPGDAHFAGAAATLAYTPMPVLLITVILWGPCGGTLATLAGALLIIYCTAHGGGPFAVFEDFPGEAVVEVQGFVMVWAVVFIMGRAMAEARIAALRHAHAWQLRYARTLDAVGMISVEYDAHTGRATWGEGARRMFGPVVEKAYSLDEWLDKVDVGERGLVQAAWTAVARGDVSGGEHDYGVRLPDGSRVRVHERLASIRGADGSVEQVVGLLRLADEATPDV